MGLSLRRLLLAAIGLLAAASVFGGEITLYEHQDFGGRRITLRDALANFEGSGFNDRASSIIVRDGLWEVCTDAHFQGYCGRFGPGEYRNLRSDLNDRISSAREVGGPPVSSRWAPSGHPRAILYEGRNFSGRSFAIEGDVVSNLADTGFNDRASSMRVEGGYWLFCTDARFEGTCRTFGPGEYASLPWDITNKISSGRRVSGRYPYNHAPNWSDEVVIPRDPSGTQQQ